MGGEFDEFTTKYLPKNKEEEFKLFAFAEYSNIPWEGKSINTVCENIFSCNKNVFDEIYSASFHVFKFDDFDFVKGERWEYVLLEDEIRAENFKISYKFKNNLNIKSLDFFSWEKNNFYLENNNYEDFFRKMIYLEFFINRGNIDIAKRLFGNFKSKVELVRFSFEKIRILHEKYDSNLEMMNAVQKNLNSWSEPVKKIDDLINIYFKHSKFDSEVNKFLARYKNKISNERRKKSDREQVTLWLKKTTKLKLQKIASDKNYSSSELIEKMIDNVKI